MDGGMRKEGGRRRGEYKRLEERKREEERESARGLRLRNRRNRSGRAGRGSVLREVESDMEGEQIDNGWVGERVGEGVEGRQEKLAGARLGVK